MAKPPKPFRLSGSNLLMFDIYTTATATGPGGMLVDKPVLSYLNVPGNLQAITTSRAFKEGANTTDKLFDLYLARKTASGVVLNVHGGWRFLAPDGSRYHSLGEGLDTDDGRQRVTVRKVRS